MYDASMMQSILHRDFQNVLNTKACVFNENGTFFITPAAWRDAEHLFHPERSPFFSGRGELNNVQLWVKRRLIIISFYPAIQAQWRKGGTNPTSTNHHILFVLRQQTTRRSTTTEQNHWKQEPEQVLYILLTFLY